MYRNLDFRFPNRIQFLSVVTTLLVSFSLSSSSSADVVVNGTFDDNSTGWVGTYQSIDGSGSFPDLDTANYYWGGNTSTTTISQTYDLTGSDLSSLAAGGLNFSMSADLFGFSTQGDKAVFTADFFDGTGGSGSLLNSVALDGVNPGSWGSSLIAGTGDNFFTTSGSVNSSTASIVFTIQSTRSAGSSNDGYADNTSFSFVSVPEPSSGTSALLLLLAAATRRKREASLILK